MTAVRVAAALGTAMLAVGCGLLGADENEMARMRDPYLGFVEAPTIEVCYQGTRIVSPSKSNGAPLSICVAKGSQARTCVSSSECGGTETCVCGRCMTRPCGSSTDCELHEVCQGQRCAKSCGTEADCAQGETCSGGGCSRLCSGPQDCAFGEKCSALDGSCIVKTCSQTVSCSGDDECVAQEEIGDLREPHVLAADGQKLAYVEIRRPAGKNKVSCAIHRARVVSGQRWEIEPIEPVLAAAPEDDDCIGAPSLLVGPDGWVMYASRGNGTGIVRAHSSDGVQFEREKDDVVFPRFDWENGWVASPGVARYGASLVLAYEADHGKAIGIATIGADGLPVAASWLVPGGFEDPVFWRSVDRIGAPFLIAKGDSLLMYLTVHGVEGYDAVSESAGVYPADPNDSIGVAETRDLAHWVRFSTGPVFARRTNLRAYLGEKDPAVFVEESSSWLVYVGSDASGQSLTGLGLAATAR